MRLDVGTERAGIEKESCYPMRQCDHLSRPRRECVGGPGADRRFAARLVQGPRSGLHADRVHRRRDLRSLRRLTLTETARWLLESRAPYPWPESSVRPARTTRRRTPSVRPSGRASLSAECCAAVRLKHHRRYRGRFARLAGLARFLTASLAAGLLLALGVSLLIMPTPAQAQATAQSATYRVTFEGKFTASALASGVSVPSGEHFTTLIGAVHNGSATFWSSGGTASAGVEAVAELGTTGTFKSEINANSNALTVIEQSIASGGTAAATSTSHSPPTILW